MWGTQKILGHPVQIYCTEQVKGLIEGGRWGTPPQQEKRTESAQQRRKEKKIKNKSLHQKGGNFKEFEKMWKQWLEKG